RAGGRDGAVDGGDDGVDGDAALGEHEVTGTAGAELLHAHYLTVGADVPVPTGAGTGLDADAGGDRARQDGLAVGAVLLLEPLEAGGGDDADGDARLGQLLAGLDRQA